MKKCPHQTDAGENCPLDGFDGGKRSGEQPDLPIKKISVIKVWTNEREMIYSGDRSDLSRQSLRFPVAGMPVKSKHFS